MQTGMLCGGSDSYDLYALGESSTESSCSGMDEVEPYQQVGLCVVIVVVVTLRRSTYCYGRAAPSSAVYKERQ